MSQGLLEIAEWLMKIERMAGEFYVLAQSKFEHDPVFAEFLSDCAEEEAWHGQTLHQAAQLLPSEKDLAAPVLVDQETKDRIEGPLRRMIDRLKSESVSDREVIGCIAETEFSEWNHIFTYVIGTLTKASREFYYPAARMQSHIRRVMHFLEATDYGLELLRQLKKIPPVWEESILVVEDDELIRNLLTNVLESEGKVAAAENGRQGLELLRRKYYKVIVSDVDMPELSGIDFFKKAVEIYPNVGRRFLFVSAKVDDFDIDGLSDQDIERLPKPFVLRELIDKVRQLMRRMDPPADAGRNATLAGNK
ncbi:MAG: response regulator [Proteobacteria bacterium]|nr:response regulator [Pseudomonadota bacterium]